MQLRLTADTTEDTMLAQYITRARQYCENYTGRALGTQTLEHYEPEFPRTRCIKLPRTPLQSVTTVSYKDYTGSSVTMSVTTDYLVDVESAKIVLPHGKSLPSFIPYPFDAVTIRYVAGFTSVPEVIKQAMLLLIGHWYENRENSNEMVGGKTEEIGFGVRALLSQYVARWF